ncbi:YlxR family protein [Clostridiaceae bacterium NSJ-31]|uniref:YlxR family protein n=1 Tax=Ligaoa zhengdingensis TaxID=2763658 RepID=A0A926DYD6_9FIRM|nr:YlxR family protein [Ligaoa zhengdingensis]MBC8545874.1 YlxR family protein [Ligaoa zhengdingensis]
MQTKKIPMRMCSGCGKMKPKRELIRVVRSPQGEISLDTVGKKPGRGAYVCNNLDCLKKARKARRLERSLSCQIPDEVYNRMEEELEKGE